MKKRSHWIKNRFIERNYINHFILTSIFNALVHLLVLTFSASRTFPWHHGWRCERKRSRLGSIKINSRLNLAHGWKLVQHESVTALTNAVPFTFSHMTSPNPWALPSWVGEPRKSGILQRPIPHSLKVARDSSKTQELSESQAFPADSNKYDAVGEHAATCVNRRLILFSRPNQRDKMQREGKQADGAKPQGTLARQEQNNACVPQTNKENLSEHKSSVA